MFGEILVWTISCWSANRWSVPKTLKRARIMSSPQPEGIDVYEEANKLPSVNISEMAQGERVSTTTGKFTWMDQNTLMSNLEEVPFRWNDHRYYLLYTHSKQNTSEIKDWRLRETTLYLQFLSRLLDSEGGQRTQPGSSVAIGNYILYGKLIYNTSKKQTIERNKRNVAAPGSLASPCRAGREIRTLLRSPNKRVLALVYNFVKRKSERSFIMPRHVWVVLFERQSDGNAHEYRMCSYDSEFREELDFERKSQSFLSLKKVLGTKCTYQSFFNNMEINARMPKGDAIDKAYWYLCRFLEFQKDANI